MDFEKYIPKDPTLMRKLDQAFKRALADYDHNLHAMDEYSDQLTDVPENQRHRVQLLDAYDQEITFYDPEMMRDYRDHMTRYWEQMRALMKDADTAQDQMGAVFSVIKESFAVAAYTGAYPIMPQFFDEVVNQVAAKYEDKSAWQEARAENEVADNVERLGPSQRAYMQQALSDLCNYSNMCLEALPDIKFLSQHFDEKNGVPKDKIGEAPYDVMIRRYCGARNIADMSNASVPDEDRDQFFRDEVEFFKKELYGEFAELFPQDRACPEMAWFISAAIDAVRIEEVEAAEELAQPKLRSVPAPKKIRLQSANDDADGKPSFVEMVSTPRFQLYRDKHRSADNDAGRTDEVIMNDPKARDRMYEILADVLNEYPRMATRFADMLSAKDYMHQMYLGTEPDEPTVGVSR